MATTTTTSDTKQARQRVPAAERRDALVEAAIHEFAQTGLHGTPVDRIARRVGVAQPYVFSLFSSKRELFLQAVERCFQKVYEMLAEAAAEFDPTIAVPGSTALSPMANAYNEQLDDNRDLLLLQQHAYAACGDDQVRPRVRACYEQLQGQIQELSGADDETVEEFFRYGMWINVNAALGVADPCQQMHWRSDDPLAGTGTAK
ncbi:MAG: TetR/AcrR family transcriptional regulator [Solirubrobacteraceae bacterium]